MFNPFDETLFLYHLTTSENQRLSGVFRGYRKKPVRWNELEQCLLHIETCVNQFTMNKKWNFSLRISSVNVTQSAVFCSFLQIWSHLLKIPLMENLIFVESYWFRYKKNFGFKWVMTTIKQVWKKIFLKFWKNFITCQRHWKRKEVILQKPYNSSSTMWKGKHSFSFFFSC